MPQTFSPRKFHPEKRKKEALHKLSRQNSLFVRKERGAGLVFYCSAEKKRIAKK